MRAGLFMHNALKVALGRVSSIGGGSSRLFSSKSDLGDIQWTRKVRAAKQEIAQLLDDCCHYHARTVLGNTVNSIERDFGKNAAQHALNQLGPEVEQIESYYNDNRFNL